LGVVVKGVTESPNDRYPKRFESIGVSKLFESNENLENMLKRSDDSLYKAKESGRNSVVVWE